MHERVKRHAHVAIESVLGMRIMRSYIYMVNRMIWFFQGQKGHRLYLQHH